MMRISKFERVEVKSLAQASAKLKQLGKEAMPLAGGTDLLVSMKQRVMTPKYLLDLNGIPKLDHLQFSQKQGLKMGPLVKLFTLAEDATIRQKYSALAEAADSVGAPQHRYMGTLGGNICLDTRCWYYNQSSFWRKSRAPCIKFDGDVCYIAKTSKVCVAVYSADTPPALIALGASIKLSGAGRERVIPLSQFYTGDGKDYLTREPDELVSEILLPPRKAKSASTYIKFRLREAIDFPLVAVAASITMDGKGRQFAEARIVLNAVAAAPVIAEEASQHLIGKEASDAVIEEAAEKAYREAKPISDSGGCPAVYRKKMVRVFTRRALQAALGKLGA